MYPPEVIQSLKEALRNIYWYKDDLRLFLNALDLPAGVVAKQGWHDPQEYKVVIAGKILDELIALGEDSVGPIRRLLQAVLAIRNFDHLSGLEEGPAKVQKARESVETLRGVVLRHDSSFRQSRADQGAAAQKIEDAVQRRNDEIESFQRRFYDLAMEENHQQRGILFEGFLKDLFAAHDLYPRGSFKITGEQIDGAFEFEGTQFLLEARWRKKRQGAEPLDAFSRKVERRLENTLGMFISLEGFTDEGLTAFRKGRPAVILWEGEDLAVVLQGLIDFRELFKRKIRHGAQTGDPFLRARDIGVR